LELWKHINLGYYVTDFLFIKNDILEKFQYRQIAYQDYYTTTAEFLTEIYECSFSRKIENFIYNVIKYYPIGLKESKAISEILKCGYLDKNVYSCQDTSNIMEKLNQLCVDKNKNVIATVNELNIPKFDYLFKNVSVNVQNQLNILHLRSDPRGFIYDLSRYGIIPTNAFQTSFIDKTLHICDVLSGNRKFFKTLKSEKYKLQRIEKLKTISDLLELLSIKKRFNSHIEVSNPKDPITRFNWKKAIPVDFSASVENYCWKTFTDMNYTMVAYDKDELLSNKVLIDDDL